MYGVIQMFIRMGKSESGAQLSVNLPGHFMCQVDAPPMSCGPCLKRQSSPIDRKSEELIHPPSISVAVKSGLLMPI